MSVSRMTKLCSTWAQHQPAPPPLFSIERASTAVHLGIAEFALLTWWLTILALAVLSAWSAPARAEIILGAGVQSYSPDGRRVEVNGVILPGDGATTSWWYYDWGDGTRNTGFFPMSHRYAVAGDYTIRVTGFNDRGEMAECSFVHSVPELPPTDVDRVILARTFLGMKEGEVRTVMVSAYDAAGDWLPLEARAIEIYAPFNEAMEVAVNVDSVEITALDFGGWPARAGWVYVYVDGVECDQPLFVIVNEEAGDFTGVEGANSAFYLPTWFFEQSFVSEADQATVLDLAYQEFAWAIHNDNKIEGGAQIQGVSYIPAVHGVNGNPLSLGDSAGPVNGVPRFDILFHETGHNFDGRRMLFLTSGILSGALYQETLAEWHVQFACNRLLDLQGQELSLPARAALSRIRDDNRAYHLFEFNNYVNGGMVFDFGSIMPSHMLVEKIYELSDKHGWERMRDFYDYFDIPFMGALADVYGSFGGATDVYRLSALVAVLGLTFGEDLRPIFVPLNFPIDDAFHDAIWQALTEPRADYDGDGDVDLDDYAAFVDCAAGPNQPPAPSLPGITFSDCLDAFDADFDRDVDLPDFADLCRVFND